MAASGQVSSRRRRRRQQVEDVDRRANRALSLVQMGELSAGRQALEAAVAAPGTQQTLDLLQDSSRRPPHPRAAMPNHIAELQPEVPLELDFSIFKECVHSARRGAAAGPSGMTAEHLKPMLETESGQPSFVRGGCRILPWRDTPRSRERTEDGSNDSTSERRRRSAGHCRGGRVQEDWWREPSPSNSVVGVRRQQPHSNSRCPPELVANASRMSSGGHGHTRQDNHCVS